METFSRFVLNEGTVDRLRTAEPRFDYGLFGEAVFYRTYSRIKEDNTNEDWADVIIRVTEGTMSIRKNWYIKNYIPWDEDFWQHFAHGFALSMFRMEWLPPGRGLWAMGTQFMWERGSMCLYNCAYTRITDELYDDYEWMMDSLMMGVGVGFNPIRDDGMEFHVPKGTYKWVIPDTREGWAHSVAKLIKAYAIKGNKLPVFDYSEIRPMGLPIKGFGGQSSGPAPLIRLHETIQESIDRYESHEWYDSVILKADIANAIGTCVVAGNVRRSAEIACGEISDPVFMDLKNYDKYPHRAGFGWMSNNSVILENEEDYSRLGEIANRVISNGEPGYLNRRNFKFGRIGDPNYVVDNAEGLNPCGEIPLEHREVCNISETFPTRCKDTQTWYAALKYATVYMSSVSLLPTHQPTTNRVVAKNRRIGASIADWVNWKADRGLHKVIKYMRTGYDIVRSTNNWTNDEAGIPRAIRVTTIKPGGTVPKLPGVVSGIGYPNFNYMLRRMRAGSNTPFAKLAVESGVPYVVDTESSDTLIFEFPIYMKGKPATSATLWEQAMNLVTVQREWADNAVSNTLNFIPKWECIYSDYQPSEYLKQLLISLGAGNEFDRIKNLFGSSYEYLVENKLKIILKGYDLKIFKYNPHHEEDDIESVLSAICPVTKSVSLLPQTTQGVYKNMPESGLTKEEYNERVSKLPHIVWGNMAASNPDAEKYCDGDKCERPISGG